MLGAARVQFCFVSNGHHQNAFRCFTHVVFSERLTVTAMPKAQRARSPSARADPVGRAKGSKNGESSDMKSSKAKMDDIGRGYLLRVMLSCWSPPRITRIIRVPTTLTFHQLHEVLQVAFGWANCHMYNFEFQSMKSDSHRPFLELMESPFDMEDMDHIKRSHDYKLRDVWDNEEWNRDGIRAGYEYDSGDSWDHMIHFMGEADSKLGPSLFGSAMDGQKIFCVAGEGHPCCEDSGGFGGWEDLKVSTDVFSPLIIH